MNDAAATVSRTFFVLAGVLAAAAIGCSPAPAAPAHTAVTAGAPHAHDPGDHNHARGKMLMASDGSYDALLTSHLSAKDGNELDIFIEDKDGPFALKTKTLQATARVGEGDKRVISFECAPANERPAKEVEGTCSHFVAKTPWMKVGEPMRVETTIDVGGHTVPMTWRDFEAKKYAHHEE